ncbi:uncharacterized protein LOC129322504 [Prosopis cineraria]|uniref:uncharacterized protein LOC129322504 n=1 Tax=Prosopis cineraria TaxID=364024 RepID=UPI00240F9872|nr:uncharacterized protein LOC129322504 [Prosopis cineraria]
MARIRPERYPKQAFKKLHARAAGPFRIIKKLGPNAYLLELPSDMAISPVFNVEDLMPYRGTFEPSPLLSDDFAGTQPSQVPIPSLPAVTPSVDEIETIMDDQMVFTSEGPIRRYLVRWRGRSDEDATWISEDEFQQLNPALLEAYQLSTSPEESSLQQGRIDRKYGHRFGEDEGNSSREGYKLFSYVSERPSVIEFQIK